MHCSLHTQEVLPQHRLRRMLLRRPQVQARRPLEAPPPLLAQAALALCQAEASPPWLLPKQLKQGPQSLQGAAVGVYRICASEDAMAGHKYTRH
jgi:hypothetical protein